MTSGGLFQECVTEIVEHQASQLGTEEFGVIPNSAQQQALYYCLDHDDRLIEGMNCFNVCTCCGLSFSGKLWWSRILGTGFKPEQLENLSVSWDAFTKKESASKNTKYHWRCLVEWRQLKQAMQAEADAKIEMGPASRMWDHMCLTFGCCWEKWPIIGCGAGFVPYKKGPSMAVEMEFEKDKFMSVLTERPPTMIDEALKATKIISYQQIAKTLDFVKLFNWLSNVFPMDPEFAYSQSNGGWATNRQRRSG